MIGNIRDTVVSVVMNWQMIILGSLGLLYAIIENLELVVYGSLHDSIQALLPAIGVFVLSLLAKGAKKAGEKKPG